MTCAACNKESAVGSISVPMQGRDGNAVSRDFPVGQRCYGLHRRAAGGSSTLRDYADICLLVPRDPAAQAWLKALAAQVSLTLRIQWRQPCATCAPPMVN